MDLAAGTYPITKVWIGLSMIASYLCTYKNVSLAQYDFLPQQILEGQAWRLVTSFVGFEQLSIFSIMNVVNKVSSLGRYESLFHTQISWFPIQNLPDERQLEIEEELSKNRSIDFLWMILHSMVSILIFSFLLYFTTGIFDRLLSSLLESVVLYRFYQNNPQMAIMMFFILQIRSQYIALANVFFKWLYLLYFREFISYLLQGQFGLGWIILCNDPIIVDVIISIGYGQFTWYLFDNVLDSKVADIGKSRDPRSRYKLTSKFGIKESIWIRMARYCYLPPWYWKYC